MDSGKVLIDFGSARISTEYKDIFNIVEITGKLDRETQADKLVRNVESLNIVDVEVFWKPTD